MSAAIGIAAREIRDPLRAAVIEVRAVIACLRDGTLRPRASPVDADAAWHRLLSVFQLDRADRDILITAVALLADPALTEEFETLAGTRRAVTAPLVAQLFAHEPALVWHEAGAAALWGLLRAEPAGSGEPPFLIADPLIPSWLSGDFRIDRMLAGIVRTEDVGPIPASWPVQATVDAIRVSLAAKRPVRLAVYGLPGSGRIAFAKAVAATLGLSPLIADMSAVAADDFVETQMRISRFAAISGCAIVWRTMPRASTRTGPVPLQCVALESGAQLAPDGDVDTLHVDLPDPAIFERRAALLALIPEAADWPERDLRRLSARDRLGFGEIERAARRGCRTPLALRAELRQSRRVANVAYLRPVDCPYRWEDLVLTPHLRARIEEFAFEVAERGALFEDEGVKRLFPRRYGLVALFAGPPGTGKTMAAQVIANMLDVELLRVDLAAVVSKYIGETAKNLTTIFEQAKNSDAILFFDEADALFSQRTEVKDSNDRYANADTNHLLQLVEQHNHGGAVILASNRPNDIDPAFRRRLRYAFNFQKPARAEQSALWRKALADTLSERASGMDDFVERISGDADLTGAQIKAAVLTALFAARRAGSPLGPEHLVVGVERELAKEGRDLSAAQRERLGHG